MVMAHEFSNLYFKVLEFIINIQLKYKYLIDDNVC